MSQDFVYREEVSKLRALRLAQRAKADLVRFAEEFTAWLVALGMNAFALSGQLSASSWDTDLAGN